MSKIMNTIFSFKFRRFMQSGMYVDFIMKKFIEVFVRNVYIYTAQFFGEKYIIEYLTKKVVDSSIFNINRIIGLSELFYSYYFIQLLGIFFYLLTFLNIIVYFL